MQRGHKSWCRESFCCKVGVGVDLGVQTHRLTPPTDQLCTCGGRCATTSVCCNYPARHWVMVGLNRKQYAGQKEYQGKCSRQAGNWENNTGLVGGLTSAELISHLLCACGVRTFYALHMGAPPGQPCWIRPIVLIKSSMMCVYMSGIGILSRVRPHACLTQAPGPAFWPA